VNAYRIASGPARRFRSTQRRDGHIGGLSYCGRGRDGLRIRTRQTVCRWPRDSHRPPDGFARPIQSDRPPSFLLPDRCAIRRVSAGSDILYPDRDDITGTELAVDCQIEHGEIASAALDLELCADRLDVFGSQRWLCPGQFSPIPRYSLGLRVGIHLVLHGHTPRLGYKEREARATGSGAGIGSVFGS
jgi:hypothetical protein